jgi:hypothetical protein
MQGRMPRPTLFDHPKFHRLVHLLGIPEPHVLGHLEYLWRVGYSSGEPVIGDELDVEIAAKWCGERGAFVRALCDERVRLLDKTTDGLCTTTRRDTCKSVGVKSSPARRKSDGRSGGHVADTWRNVADTWRTRWPLPLPHPHPHP